MHELGQPVRHQDDGQGQQRLTTIGEAELVDRAAEGDLPQSPADQQPDEHSDHNLADDLPGHPADHPFRQRRPGGHDDRRLDERERQGIVEAGLAGQGEPDLVVFVDVFTLVGGGPLHLYVGRQHWVSR